MEPAYNDSGADSAKIAVLRRDRSKSTLIWAAAQRRTFGFPKKGRFIMTNKISIEEIKELEVKRLLKDTKFSRLKPVACSRCGKKTSL